MDPFLYFLFLLVGLLSCIQIILQKDYFSKFIISKAYILSATIILTPIVSVLSILIGEKLGSEGSLNLLMRTANLTEITLATILLILSLILIIGVLTIIFGTLTIQVATIIKILKTFVAGSPRYLLNLLMSVALLSIVLYILIILQGVGVQSIPEDILLITRSLLSIL